MYVCILASTTWSLKDIPALCLWSLWSQGEADCPTGSQEELPHTHTHKRKQHRDDYAQRPKPVTDYLGSQIQLHKPSTLSHTHAHTQRGSQRAACQEDEHGQECGKRARAALELCHSHSVNIGAKEQSRKQVWTNLLNLACCSAWFSARKLLT